MTAKQESPSHADNIQNVQLDLAHDHEDGTSPDGEANDHLDDPSDKSSLPMQKRRRVTRACDTCRGKKIKCDGKQPCTHCTVYSYDCTYDQPSNRRRNPAPQYIEALENRLARAEALLKTVMPQVDLNDPALGNGSLPPLVQFPNQMPRKGGQGAMTQDDKDAMMESMIEDTGALDLDEQGRPDYYGSSSGRVFYERISRQIGTYSMAWGDANMTENFLKDKKRTFDSPRSAESPMDHDTLSHIQDLPSRECARALCEVALDDAMCLLRFMHQPTFYAMFDRIYDTDHQQWTSEEHKYLPVIYAAMALGTLFAKTEDSKLESEGYQASIENGFVYFRAAFEMIDMTDIRELTQLQTVLLLTYFIQSSAKLVTCYSFVGVALFGALRMGLHRNYPGRFNCVEDQMRKRAFWLVRKMDIYVGGILGMPILLNEDDIDQEYPAEVDDEFILHDRILPQPEDRFPAVSGPIYHNQLLNILAKIIKHVYPLNPRARSNEHTNSVSYAKIREVEKDLQEWLDTLPLALKPGSPGNQQMIRVQQMLRMSYAHVQMTLYRPFLHYMRSGHKGEVDKRYYAAAAACVSVSRNVIHIMSEMNRRHLLIGAYWFQMYSTFWAVLTLVYYAVENQDVPTAQAAEYYNCALDGRDMLAKMAKRSNAADRCNHVLQELFQRLPPRWHRGRDGPIQLPGSQRKRHAQSQPQSGEAEGTIRPSSNPRTQPRLNIMPNAPQRASTHPHHAHSSSLHTPVKAFPMNTMSPTGPSNPAAAFSDGYGRPTHGLYTPPGSTDQLTQASLSPEHPSSPSSATFGPGVNIGQAPAGVFHSMQPPVPDMVNVMFPSNDPFAYPNQPMTTFENHFGPMEGMPGAFNMVSGDVGAMARAQPQTIGNWMATSQAGTQADLGPPLGATTPGQFGILDWAGTTGPPIQQTQQAQQHQPMQHPQGGPPNQADGINYDALFVGQDPALGGMGIPGWFNENGLV